MTVTLLFDTTCKLPVFVPRNVHFLHSQSHDFVIFLISKKQSLPVMRKLAQIPLNVVMVFFQLVSGQD